MPTITGVSGTLTHGSSMTISGSSFGTKTVAAPDRWDDCSGTDPGVLWDGYWPSGGVSPANEMNYRAAQRSIPMPHSRISKYMCGCHYALNGFDQGYNVAFWRTRSLSFPEPLYFNWKERIDDNWVFGLGSPPDDNYKNYGYSSAGSIYEIPNNWYIEYNPRPTSSADSCAWHINDDGTALSDPDANGHILYWSGGVNPMSGVWRNMECEVRASTGADGYIRVWENGTLKVDYLGRTDNMSGTARSFGLGGYARSQGSTNNWRYFADIYFDNSRARVLLGDASTYTACTRREPQRPTSWAASSIAATLQLGAFGNTDAAWLYVQDSSGNVNASGFALTLGDTSAGGVILTAGAESAYLAGGMQQQTSPLRISKW